MLSSLRLHLIPIKLKTTYRSIKRSRTTQLFLLVTLLHYFTQTVVQSGLFTLDQNAQSISSQILSAAKVPKGHFAWLTRDNSDFTLQLCSHVPEGKNINACVKVFETGTQPIPILNGFRKRDDMATMGNVAVAMNTTMDGNGNVLVNFPGMDVMTLDQQCTRVLIYADQVLRNSKREELALIGSEVWLLGISIFALAFCSIPHLVAGFFFRMLSTGWSAYAIWRTQDIHIRFNALISGPQGACGGAELFPSYFHDRLLWQVPDLVLNLVMLLASSVLVWRLCRDYKTLMFTRVGAPENVVRIYRYFLGVFVCLQLSVFLVLASIALWIDQLMNGAIAHISTHTTIYDALFISTVILLLPWIYMGWRSVRGEHTRTLIAFFTTAFVLFACWAIMYYSMVYRWTWLQWPFFASLTVASQLVLGFSIPLGYMCWRNFGQGLKQYLIADAVLENLDFEPEFFDVEKPSRPPSFADMKSTLYLENEPSFVDAATGYELRNNDTWSVIAVSPPAAYRSNGRERVPSGYI
ncbi:hypothetical protein BD410DRAFT_795455 [Rickenella mellea]|uniref:Uncharacterized protein n=1 Tax=Rickenella mellea TaxID=50990 RepID=A0A4Y7PMJ4_9AGAM|nr:hypothetical protein BD410DRAFT_795455 [Rickenella mellea]